MSILNRSFSSSAAALLIAAASVLPSFPGMTSHAFGEEAKKVATKQVEKDKPTLASAAKLPSETDKATEEKKDLGYDVIFLPPPADKEESYMGPLAESMKEKYKNHILIFAFEKKGTQEAKDQDRILSEVLPGMKDKQGRPSERRIVIIKIPRNSTDKTGEAIPETGYDNAMKSLIAAHESRFMVDGENVLLANGYPDTYMEMYVQGSTKAILVDATSIALGAGRPFDENKAAIAKRLSAVVMLSNNQLEAARAKKVALAKPSVEITAVKPTPVPE